jgi:hypothetical protein
MPGSSAARNAIGRALLSVFLAAGIAVVFSAGGLLAWTLAVALGSATPDGDTGLPGGERGVVASGGSRASDAASWSASPVAYAPAPPSPVSAGAPLSALAATPSARREIELPDWALEALGRSADDLAGLRSNLQPLDPERDLDPADLAALAEIIRAGGLDEASSAFDYDDGDGVLEPWELGFQIWRDGELVLLALGPSPRFSFGYGLATLASEVGDLAALEVLDLHGNALGALPANLGALGALRALRLDENRLDELPGSLADLYALRSHNVRGNRLAALPGDLAYQEGLEELAVGGNRLYCSADPPPRLRDGSVPRVAGLVAQNCP